MKNRKLGFSDCPLGSLSKGGPLSPAEKVARSITIAVIILVLITALFGCESIDSGLPSGAGKIDPSLFP
jgi:hypothetical protein